MMNNRGVTSKPKGVVDSITLSDRSTHHSSPSNSSKESHASAGSPSKSLCSSASTSSENMNPYETKVRANFLILWNNCIIYFVPSNTNNATHVQNEIELSLKATLWWKLNRSSVFRRSRDRIKSWSINGVTGSGTASCYQLWGLSPKKRQKWPKLIYFSDFHSGNMHSIFMNAPNRLWNCSNLDPWITVANKRWW